MFFPGLPCLLPGPLPEPQRQLLRVPVSLPWQPLPFLPLNQLPLELLGVRLHSIACFEIDVFSD